MAMRLKVGPQKGWRLGVHFSELLFNKLTETLQPHKVYLSTRFYLKAESYSY